MFKRSAQVSFGGVSVPTVTDLRVIFEVDKSGGEHLNRANIEIYNLSTTSRAQLAKPFNLGEPLVEPLIRVFLRAGYEGEEVQMIAGELLSGVNQKDGPDWITTLDVVSGINAATKSTTNTSIGKPTSARVIADKLLDTLGIEIRYTEEAAQRLGRERANDFSASGLSFRETTIFLRRYDLEFTIEEDGQGLVYVENRPRNPNGGQNADNTFTPDNGLVGAPAITRTGVEFRALLRPRIRLLERIFVESQTITGTLRGERLPADYRVLAVRHTGDTRGEDWFTEIEGAYSNLLEGTYP